MHVHHTETSGKSKKTCRLAVICSSKGARALALSLSHTGKHTNAVTSPSINMIMAAIPLSPGTVVTRPCPPLCVCVWSQSRETWHLAFLSSRGKQQGRMRWSFFFSSGQVQGIIYLDTPISFSRYRLTNSTMHTARGQQHKRQPCTFCTKCLHCWGDNLFTLSRDN